MELRCLGIPVNQNQYMNFPSSSATKKGDALRVTVRCRRHMKVVYVAYQNEESPMVALLSTGYRLHNTVYAAMYSFLWWGDVADPAPCPECENRMVDLLNSYQDIGHNLISISLHNRLCKEWPMLPEAKARIQQAVPSTHSQHCCCPPAPAGPPPAPAGPC